ncbi:DUF6249 domain-containing protein [Mucilaginibacter sp. McL0603]|uniref:DUF6249 domain-containing protein n=1 Tax=Mucilaginibacter sp. McL0603 TaxID=3415670 RepID=UPI003CFB4F28
MDQHIAFFAAVVIFVIVIAVVIIAWYNYRLKKRIIDSGPIDNDAINFLKKLTDSGAEQLKWGCVLFMTGLGLVVTHYLSYNDDSVLPYGIEIMFIAAGFLIYYFFITLKQKQ